MREHAAHRARGQKLMRDPAEDPFPQAAVSIAAGHDQVCPLGTDQLQQFVCSRSTRPPPDFIGNDDAVAHEIAPDIRETFLLLDFEVSSPISTSRTSLA